MKFPFLTVLIGLLSATTAWWLLVPDPASPANSQPPRKTPSAVDSTAPAPAQEPWEIVLGIKVFKDRDCTVETRHIVNPETGETSQAFTCTPNSPVEEDSYGAFSSNVLAPMACSDAHAAEVLGLRKLGSDNSNVQAEGLNLIYRSVALSGNFEAIHRAIVSRYNLVSVNGALRIDSVKQGLVLHAIAERLGSPLREFEVFAALLLENGVSQEEINQLTDKATDTLRAIADLQTELTGDMTIRQIGDNV